MQLHEIVTQLSQITDNPSKAVYAISVKEILSAIAYRMGEGALTLSEDELNMAIEEVKVAISHNLDEREYIDMGLDAWEITRKL